MVSIHEFRFNALLGRAEDGTLSILKFDLHHDGLDAPQWVEAAVLALDATAQADVSYFDVLSNDVIDSFGRPLLARARASQVMALMRPEEAAASTISC